MSLLDSIKSMFGGNNAQPMNNTPAGTNPTPPMPSTTPTPSVPAATPEDQGMPTDQTGATPMPSIPTMPSSSDDKTNQ